MGADDLTEGWVRDVLTFWFVDIGPAGWFRKSEATDDAIRSRFLPVYETLAACDDPGLLVSKVDVALASLIVLDQFPRNMFRNSPRSFESDPLARRVADIAIARGLDQSAAPERRVFFYLPFEHSEDASDQERSVMLIAALGDADFTAYAEAHKRIIDRFGRFPHRNAVLGRSSTPEELAFLAEPGSSF